MRRIGVLAAAALLAGCTATPSGTLTGALPNPSAEPTYGSVTATPGFSRTIEVAAGGPIAAAGVSRCRGSINGPPDFNITFAAPTTVPLAISVQSSADTVVVVQAPDGRFSCDDDSGGGLNPLLRLTPQAGTYHVWVGNASSGTPGLYPVATLRFG